MKKLLILSLMYTLSANAFEIQVFKWGKWVLGGTLYLTEKGADAFGKPSTLEIVKNGQNLRSGARSCTPLYAKTKAGSNTIDKICKICAAEGQLKPRGRTKLRVIQFHNGSAREISETISYNQGQEDDFIIDLEDENQTQKYSISCQYTGDFDWEDSLARERFAGYRTDSILEVLSGLIE